VAFTKYSPNGLVKHKCDSKFWKHVHEKFPNFVSDPRNVHLALTIDGVNPFKLQRTTWSTWPVMLLNYNIPPWLTTKKFFILLALPIPVKDLMQPLIEELQELWLGVAACNL